MKLTFQGTRGYIEARTRRHRMHASLMVRYYSAKVVIDCGEDWSGKVNGLGVHAIFVTHGHPDHARGLKHGAPCPVYASQEAWENMEEFDLEDRQVIAPKKPIVIGKIAFESFPVEHSTRAQAVGYRVSAGKVVLFYVPDVVYIHDRAEALSGVKMYIGDGSTMARPMVRKRDEALIGHAPIQTQLTWCGKEGVPRAIFTHCGSEIVKGDERTLGSKIRQMARDRGVEAHIAHDGMAGHWGQTYKIHLTNQSFP